MSDPLAAKWVKTSERLPTPNTIVVVANERGNVRHVLFYVDEDKEDDPVWFDDTEDFDDWIQPLEAYPYWLDVPPIPGGKR